MGKQVQVHIRVKPRPAATPPESPTVNTAITRKWFTP